MKTNIARKKQRRKFQNDNVTTFEKKTKFTNDSLIVELLHAIQVKKQRPLRKERVLLKEQTALRAALRVSTYGEVWVLRVEENEPSMHTVLQRWGHRKLCLPSIYGHVGAVCSARFEQAVSYGSGGHHWACQYRGYLVEKRAKS